MILPYLFFFFFLSTSRNYHVKSYTYKRAIERREKTVLFYKLLICIGLTSILEALTLRLIVINQIRRGLGGGGGGGGSKARLMQRDIINYDITGIKNSLHNKLDTTYKGEMYIYKLLIIIIVYYYTYLSRATHRVTFHFFLFSFFFFVRFLI